MFWLNQSAFQSYHGRKSGRTPSTQPPFQPVEIAHHSPSFLGLLGYPPSYVNNPEIGDSEIELELETSRGALRDFTLLN